MIARAARPRLLRSSVCHPLLVQQCRAPLLCRKRTSARSQSTTASLQRQHDIDITPFFDRTGSSSSRPLAPVTGLFGQPEMSTPEGFLQLAQRTVNRAQLLVERIKQSRFSRSETFKVVKNVDRLSDMLCGVIDAAELVRHAHPDKTWIAAAHEVYESMCSYMNTLNTDVELYEVSSAPSKRPSRRKLIIDRCCVQ